MIVVTANGLLKRDILDLKCDLRKEVELEKL